MVFICINDICGSCIEYFR